MKNTLRISAALGTLAALGLCAAYPQLARAQGGGLVLSFSDALTVSGTGTTGIYHGQPVTAPMSGYTSYMDNGRGDAYYNFAAVDVEDNAAFTLQSGGTLTGSPVQGAGLFDESGGLVTISGGTLTGGSDGDGLYAGDDGVVTVSGGSFTGVNGLVDNQFGGTLTVSGGTFTGGVTNDGLLAENSEAVTISGGTFTGGIDGVGLGLGTSGAVTVSGGTFTGGYSGLLCTSGAVTVTGGTFTGFYDLDADQSATIDLYGSFTDPSGKALTPDQTENLPSMLNSFGPGAIGSFIGTLEDESAGQTFTYDNQGIITLHDVAPAAAPEPSQFAALGVGLLGLGLLGLRARRRSASA